MGQDELAMVTEVSMALDISTDARKTVGAFLFTIKQ